MTSRFLITDTLVRERFFAKTRRAEREVKPSIGACLIWTGATRNGYGHFAMQGGPMYAHRVAFNLARGRAPRSGFDVRHRCDDRRCVEPSHLIEGRRKANVRDAVRQGRHAHGEKHGNAKLTRDQVKKIRARRAAGERVRVVAASFGVSQSAVSMITSGKRWRA